MKVTSLLLRATAWKVAFFALCFQSVPMSALAAGAPEIGINIGFVADYAPERLFADAFKESRDWRTIGDTGAATTDGNGWPTQDAQLYVWAGFGTAPGTYALSFNGQATVTSYGVISNQVYDESTNTTTATLTYASGDTNVMTFTNTKRTATSAPNTGVTNIKLMRPLSPGATSSYPTDVTFTTQIKALLAKFSVIRFMDYLATNSNPQVDWSERTLPSRFSQQRFQGAFFSTPNMGAALEYAVQLCNETNTAMWINIPAKANDAYVTNVARLIAFGSDGVNPYTASQANPVWAPLNPQLKVYVEYSNEVWNTAGPFRQSQDNHDAAIAEVNAGGSPLNFDGATGDWDWAARRTAKRTVEISNMFRAVFGDSAMPADAANVQNFDPRVRPVLESQLGYAAFWHYQQARMLQDYYNTPQVSTPRPPSYYVYGGGGSAYYGPNNSGPWDLDSVWSNATFADGTWANMITEDAGYDLPLFGRRIAYEGGPSLDTANAPVDSLKEQVWSDPRITEKISGHQKIWNQQGGGLLMYFNALGDYQWSFSHTVDDLNTAKFAGIDAINSSTQAPGTAGATLPTAIDANAAAGPNYPPSAGNMQAAGTGQPTWLGYVMHNDTAEAFKIGLKAGSAGAGNQADIYIDGWLIGTIAIPDTGSNNTQQATATLTTSTLAVGAHGLLVKAKTGSFGFSSVIVANNTGGLLPSAPGTLTASSSSGQVTLYWGAANNATSYNIYRGTSARGEAAAPISTGVTATTFVDNTVTNGTIYYYYVAGVDATGVGSFSNETTAAPDAPPPTHPGITSVRFFPRANWATRTVGGLFQGSDDNSTWTTLVTVTTLPPEGIWTTLQVSDSTEWRYVRYLGPDGGSCNVAEIEFYHDATKLAGIGFGSPGSYGNGSNTFDKALDGSTTSYFDAAHSSGDFVGLDLGGSSTPVAPVAPTNVSALAGDQQVVLSWTAGSGATTYNIYRGTAAGGEGTTPVASAVASSSYTDEGLTNGAVYFYKIAGVNAAGVGAKSAEVSATPIATSDPGSGHGVTSVRFYPRANWAQRMTGGLFQGSNDNSTWTTLATVASQPPADVWTTLPVSNQTQQWRYVRYLSPVDSFGDVAEVEFYEGAAKLTGTAFGTPGSWNGSGSTFDKALDGDTGTFFDNGEGAGNYVGLDLGASGPTIPAGGPQAITSIRFYPRAPDSAWRMQGGLFQGSNDNSTWTTLASLVGVYPPDNTWTTVPVTDTAAWRYVRFLSSSVNTYDALNIAELEFYNGTTKLTGTGIGTSGSYQNNPALTFDKALDGDIATYVDNVPGAYVGLDLGAGSGGAIPTAPTGLIASAGTSQVSLTWTAATGAISYNVYRGTTAGGENTTPVATNITDTTYTNSGLINGTTYYYKVAGVNLSGVGPQSAEASATPVATGIGPQTVTSIRFYPRAPDSAWRMQGGLFQGSNDNTTWTILASLVDVYPPDNTWTTLAVTNTSAWRYVRFLSSSVNTYDALNIAELEFYNGATKLTGTGIGTPGSYQNDPALTFDQAFDGDIATYVDNVAGAYVGYDFGVGALAPAAPGGLTATAGGGQISLLWSGTGAATSYSIYRGTTAAGEGVTPIATGVTATTYTDTGLVNGTTYFYLVVAVNVNGTSSKSNEVSATPLASLALPAAPVNLTATAGDAQISLSWTAATDAVSYTVYRGTTANGEGSTPVATAISGTTYTNAGLTNGTTYYYTVAGVNVNGIGAQSNETSATPVPADSAPVVTLQPVARTTAIGATATFTVQVTATPSPTYQWRKNGVPISGNSSANTPTLALNSITNADGGNYDVVVTNSLGSAQSDTAALTVGSTSTPSTGRLGINAGFVNDWTGEVVFADAMKVSRTWEETTLDANGWPQTDSSIYVWAGTAANYNSGGTYALSFTGQATVTGATLVNKLYDTGTNTTTASITLPANADFLRLTFADTKRLATSAANTGITNVKLMRPIEPGASVSYSPDTVFTTHSKAFYTKFSAIRYMDWLSTNSNPSVNWSDRTRPDWASQSRWQGEIWSSPQMGAAWEYAVRLSNETNTDMWICVPVGANDDYVAKLAQLIAYGSDGANPYTSLQANPVWAPLNPGLKVYVEFSNEVWNTAGPFGQSQTNHTAAQAEVAAGNSPLNFDGATGDWIWAARRTAKRTIEISNIFRGVFGNSAMMTRVRPVLQSQQNYTGFWALEQAHLMEEYYNNPDRVAEPHAPSYYVYGSGGSAYYSPDNSSTSLTIENIWTSELFAATAWAPISRNESAYALNLYGHRVAYEGGPAMDSGGSNAVKQAAWNHSLMTDNVADHQITWEQSDGELLMYYVAIGDYQWGFAHSVFDLNTPKMAAVDRINASTPAAPTIGSAIPATIPASARVAPEANVGDTNNLSVSGGQALYATSWIGYVVRNDALGTFNIALQGGSAVAGSQAEIYVDGVLVGTVDVANTGSNETGVPTTSVTTANLPIGAHGLMVKAKAGSFGFQSIFVTDIPLSGAPGEVTATAGSGQISLSWNAASNATTYNVYRGTVAGAETLLVSGVVATSYVDASVATGTTYFYKVAGVNDGGSGPQSNEVSATPLSPAPEAPTGLVASAGNAQVYLNWTAAAAATSYNVYRGTAAGGESSTPVATGVSATHYTDTGLTNGMTYFYTVDGANASGAGPRSNEVSAQPVAPAVAPAITGQPVSQTKNVGDSVSFAVVASGVPAPSYQWRKGGVPITGNSSALTATLSLPSIDTSDAGSYDVVVTNPAGSTASNPVTLTVQKIASAIALSNLTQGYDGTPRNVTITTVPSELSVEITYNGSSTVPVYPGSYAVVATIDDDDFVGSASGTLIISATALVRHAPTMNAAIDGSVQVLLPESTILNGSAWISGDLLVPGTPALILNGHPNYGGTLDASGHASPANYSVILNGNTLLRHLVRRVNAIAMPTVSVPPQPSGTRNVALTRATDNAGDFATVRNLTLSGAAGMVAVPPGNYGMLKANGTTGFILGVPNSAEPAVYNFQSLGINVLPGSAKLQIVGPVVITVATGTIINGPAGSAANPKWFTLRIASGGLTLSGSTIVHGQIVAPNGTVTLNNNATLDGTVISDRLIINGTSLLSDPSR